MKYLVIVESPAKCKKIEKYLNDNDDINIYEVVATMGHITELRSLKDIDINNNFTCKYELIESKKKNTELIRKKLKNIDEVILAMDGDREGEGISYSIIDFFKLPLTTKRIIFNEITEQAILNAIKNPKKIDMNLVHAQHSRQILDLLVGFKISPMLWKFIANKTENSLSAGRCQSPALKLIYENQKEINESREKKIYNIIGNFTNLNLAFKLNKDYELADEVKDFLNGSTRFNHIYNCSNPKKVFKSQPEPLTTSRLQQIASNELHLSPKETMQIAQTLYEGGYITYMRTDSKTYCKEFIDSVKKYINYNYESKFINENIDNLSYKSSNNNITQDAHEAIRPTNISLVELPETIKNKEKKLYTLIWVTTLESCMSSASFYSVDANITAFNSTTFTYTSEIIDFPGWKIVSKKYPKDNKEYQYLQTMKQNSIIPYKKIIAKVNIKDLKQHYSESRLVQLLEERGIGRPSTFSSIIDKIQERGYVKKDNIKGKEILCVDYELENNNINEIVSKREFGNESKKLIIQQLGIMVIDFLEKHFLELFNYNYTSYMEDELDKISKGEKKWFDLCNECNTNIDKLLYNLNDTENKKIQYKIDENNTYLIGKYGPVIKCVERFDNKNKISFKQVKNDIDFNKLKNGEYKIIDLVDTSKKITCEYNLGKYNNEDIILRKNNLGLFVSYGKIVKQLKEFGNRPVENITLEEVLKYLEENNTMIRELTNFLSIRKSSKGNYIFYKTNNMKKPNFYDISCFKNETKQDYTTCDKVFLIDWIKNKYEISII
jgi:DNA topoisomerase-1